MSTPAEPAAGAGARVAAEPAAGSGGRGPIREVFGDPAYRSYWIAQFLAQLVAGSLRFAFVWLVLLLTDWPRAAGLVSLAAGLPSLVLSLPAGAWSDRVDRGRLIVRGTLALGAGLALTALLVASGTLGFGGAVLMAGVVATAHAVITPAQQAIVPSLVPEARLTTGVALQQLGMQVAFFLGAVVNGGAIRLLGIAPAFGVMAGLAALSALAMARVRVPPGDPPDGSARLLAQTREGLAFVLGREPIRSLTLASTVVGIVWGTIQINLPVVAKEQMARSAFEAAVLVGAFTPGSLLSSLALASRRELARKGRLFALAFGVGLGPGAVAMGLAGTYAPTLALMGVWGLFGGIVMTTQRSLVQELTPPAMMGRAMGIATLAVLGAFPLAAGLSAALAPRLGPGGTIVAVAAAASVLAPALVMKRAVWRA